MHFFCDFSSFTGDPPPLTCSLSAWVRCMAVVRNFRCNWGTDCNQLLLIPISTLGRPKGKYTFLIILLNLISSTCTGKYWSSNEISDRFLQAARQFRSERGKREMKSKSYYFWAIDLQNMSGNKIINKQKTF